MNITHRQLETFAHSARLGSFNAAAAQLNTTQSAVSKRIAEIEAQLGGALFTRSARGLVPTELGRRLLPLADEALALWGRIGEAFAADDTLRGNWRVGVTELVALTWLAPWIQQLQQAHPEVTLEPVVDAGVKLFERLQARQLELCVMPGTWWGSDFNAQPVGQVEQIWVASPALALPALLQPADFAQHPVVEEAPGASKRAYYTAWRAQQGYRFGKVMHTNSTTLLRDLTLRGFGIAQLSREYVGEDLKAGRLRQVLTPEPMPPMVYSAVCRADADTPALRRIVALAGRACDFNWRG